MSRDQGPTNCCTGRCNQGRACVLHTTNGGMASDGMHITMDDANQPWDWFDGALKTVARCVLVFAAVAIVCAAAGFVSVFFK